MIAFDRKVFFDAVRPSLFAGSMTQAQVDGMNYKMDVWEDHPYSNDLRHIAYPFATSYHETGQRMEPVREGFSTSDAAARSYVKKQGYAYAKPDPVTGEVYYGRGDVQLTWADNYKKATSALGLSGMQDLYRYPEQALDAKISADAMYKGMTDGWYRSDSKGKQTLARYFSASADDPYGAREIINGDKAKVPSWSGGVPIGNLIAGYHKKFLSAFEAAAYVPTPEPEPAPTPEPEQPVVRIDINVSAGARVLVSVNGEIVGGPPA